MMTTFSKGIGGWDSPVVGEADKSLCGLQVLRWSRVRKSEVDIAGVELRQGKSTCTST